MIPKQIPRGIKILTLARGIRWFGWGMCETLIPVLLFSFSHTYAGAGIFYSIYAIVFLLSLPFISTLSDRISTKSIILFALILYPFIGLSYFFAGAFGITFFIILARVLNGIAWCCDSVGGDTYLRRFALEHNLSKTFGYLSSLPNLSWIIAALISIPFLSCIPIHYFFLSVVATSMGAYFVMKKAPIDQMPISKEVKPGYFSHVLDSIKGMRHWQTKIWILASLIFFVACIDILGYFFLPLFAYAETNSLSQVVIITVIFSIPSVFSVWFGTYIDKVSKWVFVAINFLIISFLLSVLSFISSYMLQAIGIFILGVLTVCINLAIQALVTQASKTEHYGRVGGLMAGADQLGIIIGPIVIGFLADWGGMKVTFLTLGVISLIITLGCLSYKKKINSVPSVGIEPTSKP